MGSEAVVETAQRASDFVWIQRLHDNVLNHIPSCADPAISAAESRHGTREHGAILPEERSVFVFDQCERPRWVVARPASSPPQLPDLYFALIAIHRIDTVQRLHGLSNRLTQALAVQNARV
jgi:hypothetical protein